jgi:uncharacterized membrane protein
MSTALAHLSRGYLQHVPGFIQVWERKNVNPVERGISVALGALLVLSALRVRGLARKASALGTGSALLARGLAGRCPVYRKLGVTSA